jgi:hypothetical protein
MPYLITARSAEGVVTLQSKTAAGALETAAQLAEFGLMEISIIDNQGQHFSPDKFYKQLQRDF